ncbi:MAG: YlmC/YmxH family sporulation protein [Bacilli bacterium]|jgi:YlmC/YmxH family sporulation protein|nr:YlmC/YmxH family sporulation protein [Bacilli bacterium]
MRLADLQRKDIVSLKDGKRLGRIVDVEIDGLGEILYLVIEPKRLFRIFGSSEETTVTFKQINKIGEDVILVDL